MLIVNGVRPFVVPLGLAPGAVIPWFFWAAANLHLALSRLAVVLALGVFFDASGVSVSIGTGLSILTFFPKNFACTGVITVEMSAVLVLVGLVTPPSLFFRC